MREWISWPATSIALAVLGIGVTSYLSYVAFNADALTCAISDCGTAQSSDYAKIAGIPIALLGLGMYITVVALGLVRASRPGYSKMATFSLFAIVLASVVYYGYLTYIEIWVIEAICQWCVASALLTVGLLASEGTQSVRLLRE
jgi:uncharacterized membrane protein